MAGLMISEMTRERMVATKRDTLVSLTCPDRVIEGSPQNAVTAVNPQAATPISLE